MWYVVGWLVFGFIVACIRYGVSGKERIIIGVAQQNMESAADNLGWGHDPEVIKGFLTTEYEEGKKHALAKFFLVSTLAGPIGVMFFLISWVVG